ncbi:MAG: bifunctional UDP-N-acetylglucosamine diphosphorylase/glucosamine-1-phosphate N-acetyltransferase GlmU [Gammaproteobacteria bacterium]
MALSIVILAAGQGTRMRSNLPKVLHPLAGVPLLEHVVRAARTFDGARIQVVYGHGGDTVRARLAHLDVGWVEQAQQLGTGHAVTQALPGIEDGDTALILYGDVPLTRTDTLRALVESAGTGGFSILTAVLDDATGYGRILRDDAGRIVRIVEHKDASPAEREVREINTGMMAVGGAALKRWLARVGRGNAQGEYYLTDIVALAVADGVEVRSVRPSDPVEIAGVNDRVQLAGLERAYQQARAEELMRAGVTLRDPARFDLRGELSAGRDVVIDVNVVIEGRVTLGDNVAIGPNVMLRDCEIGADTQIHAMSIVEESVVGRNGRIGPFARLRPQSRLAEDVHIGNFVELKKTSMGPGAKANHLTYLGDAEIGAKTNIGAGTITCNYDGVNKSRTEIGDDVFIGSDTMLVAPVKIGDGATTGAGTTVTREVPPGKLVVGRAREVIIEGWQRPKKKK